MIALLIIVAVLYLYARLADPTESSIPHQPEDLNLDEELDKALDQECADAEAHWHQECTDAEVQWLHLTPDEREEVITDVMERCIHGTADRHWAYQLLKDRGIYS